MNLLEFLSSSELILSGIISLIIGFSANRFSLFLKSKENRHEFKIKTFESIEEENKDLRKENDMLKQTNLDLRGLNLRLENEIESLKRDNRKQAAEIERLSSEIFNFREREYQLRSELELVKKRNDAFSDRLSNLEKLVNP